MPAQPPHDRLLPGAYEPPLGPVDPVETAGMVSFRHAIAVVRRRFQLILALTTCGAALVLFLASREATSYSASAMLRLAGLPARVRWVTLAGDILRGIPGSMREVDRPLVEVWLQDQWLRTDTFIYDAACMAAATSGSARQAVTPSRALPASSS